VPRRASSVRAANASARRLSGDGSTASAVTAPTPPQRRELGAAAHAALGNAPRLDAVAVRKGDDAFSSSVAPTGSATPHTEALKHKAVRVTSRARDDAEEPTPPSHGLRSDEVVRQWL
jgi:hypothetical protein